MCLSVKPQVYYFPAHLASVKMSGLSEESMTKEAKGPGIREFKVSGMCSQAVWNRNSEKKVT